MKIKIIIIGLVLAAGISACKKSNNASVILVKTKTNTPTSGTAVTDTFSYNSQNWVSSIKGSDGSKTLFTNTSSAVTEMVYNTNGSLTNTNIYYLNAQSLADSEVQYNNLSGTYVYYKNTYSGNYLASQIRYNNVNTPISIYTYYTQSGNIDSVPATQFTGGFLQSYNTYAYASGDANTIGNTNTGQPYLGSSSANVYTTNLAYAVSNNTTNITTYTYVADGSGRIATQNTFVGGSHKVPQLILITN